MSSKQKFWLILFVLLLTCLYSWLKPGLTIYSSGDIVMVDRILSATIWVASCWLCVSILKCKEKEKS